MKFKTWQIDYIADQTSLNGELKRDLKKNHLQHRIEKENEHRKFKS